MIKSIGKSSDSKSLSEEQAKTILSYLGFKDKADYLENIYAKLKKAEDSPFLPPIKTVKDLSRITISLGLGIETLLFGPEISKNKEKIAQLHSQVYPGEEVHFPDATIRLSMKFIDYLFSQENYDSRSLN